MRNFTNTFLDCVKPGSKVLDLGAGEGIYTQMFLDQGASVTAVDTRPPAFDDAKLIVKKMTVEDFCRVEETGRYNLVFARNVIQFLDKNWVFENLFPWLEDHLEPDGVIAIETFYQDPEPPFDHPMSSLYRLDELNAYFISWQELRAREYEHVGFDLAGQTRKFFISSLIARKVR
jgi:2-polyprenyl-3-methyl-5-hydroxy-6-metoxy-1,4-benzoquinol methylase